jgi:hypothetical protein
MTIFIQAVNCPHDITLYGDTTKKIPTYNFKIDSSLPDVPPAPTADEDLSTKPLAQASYKEQYQKAFQPTTDTEEYRKLYYTLQKKVDNEIGRVLKALEDSSFLENTIVVFTSDHGDLLGAHGNFQKWFNMYEEAVHVPLTFYSKTLLPHPKHIDILTSHVDLLPTLCGLADIDPVAITTKLQETFTNSQNLVGRDLSKVIKEPMKPSEIKELEEPILFLTYDQILTGSTTQSAVNTPYQYVEQPAFINAVISKEEGNEIWKLAMYFEDQTFSGAPLPCTCSTPIDSPNFPNMVQFEMYNLSSDPLETQNLADEAYATPKTRLIQRKLYKALKKQLAEKALVPSK